MCNPRLNHSKSLKELCTCQDPVQEGTRGCQRLHEVRPARAVLVADGARERDTLSRVTHRLGGRLIPDIGNGR